LCVQRRGLLRREDDHNLSRERRDLNSLRGLLREEIVSGRRILIKGERLI
jgi:hypothetical protein